MFEELRRLQQVAKRKHNRAKRQHQAVNRSLEQFIGVLSSSDSSSTESPGRPAVGVPNFERYTSRVALDRAKGQQVPSSGLPYPNREAIQRGY